MPEPLIVSHEGRSEMHYMEYMPLRIVSKLGTIYISEGVIQKFSVKNVWVISQFSGLAVVAFEVSNVWLCASLTELLQTVSRSRVEMMNEEFVMNHAT